MKTEARRGRLVAAMLLLAALGTARGADQQVDLSRVVRELSVEVRVLRLQVARLEMESVGRQIVAIEREFEGIQRRRAKVEARERNILDEAAALERHRNDPSLSEDERKALEAANQNAGRQPDSELAKLRTGKDELVRREAEVGQQIQQERWRWQQVRAAADSLEAELGQMQRGGSGR